MSKKENKKTVTINDDDIVKLIATAKRSHTSMKKAVQSALVGMVRHASEHGDKRVLRNRAPELIKVLPGANTPAIVKYLCKFGGVEVQGKGFVDTKSKANLEGAIACDWATLKVQNPYAGFNLDEEINKLIKRAEGAQEKADNDPKAAKVINIRAARMIKLRQMRTDDSQTESKDVLAA